MTKLRDLIMDVIGGEVWTAETMRVAVENKGWSTRSRRPGNIVGNALARLAGEGAVECVGRGLYKGLPSLEGRAPIGTYVIIGPVDLRVANATQRAALRAALRRVAE